MAEKPVTIIVSDLHLGGGPADPGDDHVYDRAQLKAFLDELSASTAGQRGDIELIFNGDFLEFAQVAPDVYSLISKDFWCSQPESLRKLAAILDGHRETFAALARFAKRNAVTIAAGNHDVDLYWPGVQAKLRQEIGASLGFELGETWYERYNGWLRIGHGHMFDPGNKFENWADPIRNDGPGGPRLEMCPGTLFMVKFVNWLEAQYPFADNVKPFSALRQILWNENKMGYAAIAARFADFAMRHPSAALGADVQQEQVSARIAEMIGASDLFALNIADLYSKARGTKADADLIRTQLHDRAAVDAFVTDLIVNLDPDEWLPILDQAAGGSLAIGGQGTALSINRSGTADEKQVLRDVAESQFDQDGAPSVVVMGHTHQPDSVETERGVYFNPGSWTRYVELERTHGLKLDDLRDESRFPYELNFVRIDAPPGQEPKAEMICFDKRPGFG